MLPEKETSQIEIRTLLKIYTDIEPTVNKQIQIQIGRIQNIILIYGNSQVTRNTLFWI